MDRFEFQYPGINSFSPYKVVAGPMERWRNTFLLTTPEGIVDYFSSPSSHSHFPIQEVYLEPHWTRNQYAGFYFWYPDYQIPVVPEQHYSDSLVTTRIEVPIGRIWEGLEASAPEMQLKKVVTTHPELYEAMLNHPLLRHLAEYKQIDYALTNPDVFYDVKVPSRFTRRDAVPAKVETPQEVPQPYVGLAGATTNVYLPGGLIAIDDPLRGRWYAHGSFPKNVDRLLRRHADLSGPASLSLLFDLMVELGVIKPSPPWSSIPNYPSEKIQAALSRWSSLSEIKALVRELREAPPQRQAKKGSFEPTVNVWGLIRISDLIKMLSEQWFGGK